MSRPILRRAALALTLVPAVAAAQERLPLRGGSVAIFNVAGVVRVEAGTGSDVMVEVTRGGGDARKLEVATMDKDGIATLVVKYPDDEVVYPALGRNSRTESAVNRDGTFGGQWRGGRRIRVRGSGSGLEAWADLRVLVPAGKRVHLGQVVGRIEGEGTRGTVTVDAASAAVTWRGHEGGLAVDNGSGTVTVERVTGDLELDTGSGGVTLDGITSPNVRVDVGSGSVRGRDIRADRLMVDAGSGGVSLEGRGAGSWTVDTGSGSVTLRLTSLPRDLTVDAGSGGVSLTLPANAGAELDIETGSGGITSDFPVTVNRSERNTLRGRIGDGGARIRVETGSGSVRILK